MRRRGKAALVVLVALLGAGCSGTPPMPSRSSARSLTSPGTPPASPSFSRAASPKATHPRAERSGLPGMPPLLDPHDVWAADRPGALAPTVRHDRSLVYVPNTLSDTVSVIDPRTYKVVKTVRVGHEPQHVVPSWDLRTLWVNNDLGNSLTPIDAATGRFGRPVKVSDPYNLYFTPNGRFAIVMASADRELVFRDPHSMAVRRIVRVPCAGVNHADFSADGRYFLVSCEFSGEMLKVDTVRQRVLKVLRLPGGGMSPKPQDVKAAPDGRTFYVADMMRGGVWVLDGDSFRVTRFLRTGKGAHGLYVTRDSRHMLITNRDEGSVSVLDFATRRLAAKWRIPGRASPDMGGLSADGKVFWVSGRYDSEVYAISTTNGRLIRRIRVGGGPHGLCVWPQPGRYSLGHTGILR